jgi:hypothetical protein
METQGDKLYESSINSILTNTLEQSSSLEAKGHLAT